MTINEITNKILPNKHKLKRFLIRAVTNELGNLSEACYYPKVHRYYYELLDLCKISEKELKTFVKDTYFPTKAKDFLLVNDPYTNLILIITYFFLTQRDPVTAQAALIFLHLKFYTSTMTINIRYCNPNVFLAALERIPKTHLFRREKTIGNSLMYLSKEIMKKYRKSIQDWSVDSLIALIQQARHRISQSVKSFAKSYYKVSKEKGGFRTPSEEEEPFGKIALEKGKKLIDDVVNDVTVYKHIDKKALAESKAITKISISTASSLVKVLTNVKFSEKITTCLTLFIKDLSKISDLCRTEYFKYVRLLMSVKRSKKPIYFKQQIILLTEELVKEFNFYDSYRKLSFQSKFMTNLFVALYITMVLRNRVC